MVTQFFLTLQHGSFEFKEQHVYIQTTPYKHVSLNFFSLTFCRFKPNVSCDNKNIYI